jgi:hypothetical protein
VNEDDEPEPPVGPGDLLSEEEAFDDSRTSLPGVPTIDRIEDDNPGPVEYVHWDPATTKVVSGPVGPAKNYPGRRFPSKGAALRYWKDRAGRIIQDLSIAGRWIFRVRRDA